MDQMFVVKYQSGCLGNFLCHLLGGFEPFTSLDYGGPNLKNKILHTGAYSHPNDPAFLTSLQQKKFKIISHNNPNFDNWIKKQNYKSIFINLHSHFIEYRLNYILKMPALNNKLNEDALGKRWKGFKYPIACDDARRMVRLSYGVEQCLKKETDKDITFNFGHFYLPQQEWVIKIENLLLQVNKHITKEKLVEWYISFKKGQQQVLSRSAIVHSCIANYKFVDSLNENEKGLIVGNFAIRDKKDDPMYFIETYEKLSKNKN